ncbi:type II toxin-antitoxin system HicB family antitoxin [Salinibaculum rarum]|uniref:type II toxin-antitoxin system HicB family antitoxin n=1 Tax=Salinibaculum rarum TaxID=3058903 RepID=UPI00265DA8C6|nr:type II toxin-antitoxin system HicB family antitoxin [Salinibaculum sp. KK48]
MASSTADGDDPEQEIRLVDSGTWWVATDVETGIASQGKTRSEALSNLDEAVSLQRGAENDPVETSEQERAILDELGIDPDEVERAREDADSLPEFMQ